MAKTITEKLEDDKQAEKIGANLAALLRLRKDVEDPTRWATAWGTKTSIGLARTIYRVFEETE